MEEQKKRRSRLGRLKKRIRNLSKGARNAAEILQKGRLGAPYRANYETILSTRTFNLRHYTPGERPPSGAPLLFVPPLMVSSEIYDISPELSGVGRMMDEDVDVWLVDFGAPEDTEGGLERTLDDHVLAVDRAIDEVHRITGQDVHLLGYSQGGMFVYQAAAYRRSQNVASIVTFGSPVDIWRNLPGIHEDITGRMIEAADNALRKPLEGIASLPGALTSNGFKILNARKEVQQITGFLGLLHNREALQRREPKRRFLGGEGFVAWPGPALRDFIQQVIVNNRMASGGLLINNKAVSLADINTPILCFIGERDDMVRPASVRALHTAAPNADIHEITLPVGHFGLVVGSRAMSHSWPTVAQWIRWQTEGAEIPALLREEAPERASEDDKSTTALYDTASDLLDGLWHKLGDASREFTQVLDTVRWQIPRLARLESLHQGSEVSISRMLAEQADAIPEEKFFLWKDRAFSYAEANDRVHHLALALQSLRIKQGDFVGVLLDNQPDFLTLLSAINRLGAVSVVLPPCFSREEIREAAQQNPLALVVSGRRHRASVAATLPDLEIYTVHHDPSEENNTALEDLADFSAEIDPADLEEAEGRAEDLALVLFTSGTTGPAKPARITNRRWVAVALGAAAMCRLSPGDTVYSCLSLSYAMGLMVAVGGALAGGSRLALAPEFSPETFWPDVRRTGASVVFYSGDLCRRLVDAPASPHDASHPVRLFAGTDLDAKTWERMSERFDRVRVINFYGSTEGNVVLVNLGGKKKGAVGRPPVGEEGVTLLRCDPRGNLLQDEEGRYIPCLPEETGRLAARIRSHHPLTHFDGYAHPLQDEEHLIHGVKIREDTWFLTDDMLRRDGEGDYWFVARLQDLRLGTLDEIAVLRDQLQGLPGVRRAALFAQGEALCAALEAHQSTEIHGADCFASLGALKPEKLFVVERMPTTPTLKESAHVLGALSWEGARVYARDDDDKSYRLLDQ